MGSPQIIVPNWTRRQLEPGFVWQRYFLSAIQWIPEQRFSFHFGSSLATMKDALGAWQQNLMAFINNRALKLGMEVDGIYGHLMDEPNTEKRLEVALWNVRSLKFVWTVWAYLLGPIQEELQQEGVDLPIENFWPKYVNLSGGVAEVLDATRLTAIEQGTIIATDEYDV